MADVLVVDDDLAIRQMIADLLELEGHSVVGVADADAVERYLHTERPDCIVLDVLLPGRDGFEVLAWIRAQPGLHDLPVALLTASTDDATVWRGWQSGASWFFNKPIDADALRDFVSALQPGRHRRAAPTSSPYEMAVASEPLGLVAEQALLQVVHTLESQALFYGRGQLVFLCLPGPNVLRDSRMVRLEQLAARGNDVVVMGRRIPRRIGASGTASLVPLRQDDRLQRELVHLVAGPRSSSVLVARPGEGMDTRWTFAVSHNSQLVEIIVDQLLQRVPHLHLAVPETGDSVISGLNV